MLFDADTDEGAWHHVDPRILKTSWNNLEKLVRQSFLSFYYLSYIILSYIIFTATFGLVRKS